MTTNSNTETPENEAARRAVEDVFMTKPEVWCGYLTSLKEMGVLTGKDMMLIEPVENKLAYDFLIKAGYIPDEKNQILIGEKDVALCRIWHTTPVLKDNVDFFDFMNANVGRDPQEILNEFSAQTAAEQPAEPVK